MELFGTVALVCSAPSGYGPAAAVRSTVRPEVGVDGSPVTGPALEVPLSAPPRPSGRGQRGPARDRLLLGDLGRGRARGARHCGGAASSPVRRCATWSVRPRHERAAGRGADRRRVRHDGPLLPADRRGRGRLAGPPVRAAHRTAPGVQRAGRRPVQAQRRAGPADEEGRRGHRGARRGRHGGPHGRAVGHGPGQGGRGARDQPRQPRGGGRARLGHRPDPPRPGRRAGPDDCRRAARPAWPTRPRRVGADDVRARHARGGHDRGSRRRPGHDGRRAGRADRLGEGRRRRRLHLPRVRGVRVHVGRRARHDHHQQQLLRRPVGVLLPDEPGQSVVYEAVRRAVEYAYRARRADVAAAGNAARPDQAGARRDEPDQRRAEDVRPRPVDNTAWCCPRSSTTWWRCRRWARTR